MGGFGREGGGEIFGNIHPEVETGACSIEFSARASFSFIDCWIEGKLYQAKTFFVSRAPRIDYSSFCLGRCGRFSWLQFSSAM